MSINEPDFQGRIGRTVADSEPAWPEAPAAPGDSPNVVMIVLDDTGFAHLGCFGSTIDTPNIDRLAAGGLRYTGFHTTALCSPSRACFLTGRNHHAVGMRGVSNCDTGFAAHARRRSPRRRQQSPNYCAHTATRRTRRASGTSRRWTRVLGGRATRQLAAAEGVRPLLRLPAGRDRSVLSRADGGQPPHRPARTPEEGYHVSEDLIDQSIGWVRDLKSVLPERPFFLYLAFGATHAPHQAPLEYREKYRAVRQGLGRACARSGSQRQVETGHRARGDDARAAQPGRAGRGRTSRRTNRSSAARLQEAFAAFLDHTDAQVGRLVDFLEERGLLDDTLIMFVSDNGASQEGGPRGVMDEFSFFNLQQEDIDDIVANRLDDIGGPHSHSNFPWGWAQAGNTPLRWYKQNTYGGGHPRSADRALAEADRDRGGIRNAVLPRDGPDADDARCHGHHGAGGVSPASSRSRCTGRASSQRWDVGGLEPRSAQYFEQAGHRGIVRDGWKAVTHHTKGQAVRRRRVGAVRSRRPISRSVTTLRASSRSVCEI